MNGKGIYKKFRNYSAFRNCRIYKKSCWKKRSAAAFRHHLILLTRRNRRTFALCEVRKGIKCAVGISILRVAFVKKKRKKHPDFREKSVERKSFSLSIKDGLYMHSVVSAHVITRQFISSQSRQARYRIREEYSTPRIPFSYSVSENDSINTAIPVLPMRNTQSCV